MIEPEKEIGWHSAERHDFQMLTKRVAIHRWAKGVTRTYRIASWGVRIFRDHETRKPTVTIKPAHECAQPFWHRPQDDWRVPFKWAPPTERRALQS